MTDAPADIAALSFEQALAELEKIVAELESGQAPLERSIEIYKRGAALKAHCEAKLDAARLPHKHSRAQFGLDQRHVLAQCGLGDAQRARSRGHAARSGDFHKIPELAGSHGSRRG